MESQTMVSDPEGFSRAGGMNYSDMKHLLCTLEECIFTQTDTFIFFLVLLKMISFQV